MKKQNLGYLLIVLQSFAFFVALSVFLGRIYFITYYDRLGIPSAEVSLNLIDYTVISPNVTILGIGSAALLTVHILITVLLYRSAESLFPVTWHYGRIVTGMVLLAMSVLLAIPDQDAFLATHPELAKSGLLGLWSLLRISLNALALYFILFGVPLITIFNSISSLGSRVGKFRQSRTKNEKQFRSTDGEPDVVHKHPSATIVLVPILLLIVVILTQLFSITFGSARFGRMEADIALQEAPHVEIAFNDSLDGTLVSHGANQCSADYNVCRFELILIGERFVFVKPILSESTNEATTTYALPINDLAQIAYAPKTEDN